MHDSTLICSMFNMDESNLSLSSLYSLLIGASFDKLNVTQLDDFRKILVVLAEEFSNQCECSGLPTKELDMLRAFLSVMDLSDKTQKNISGELEEKVSLGPASNHMTENKHEQDMQGRFSSCGCHCARRHED